MQVPDLVSGIVAPTGEVETQHPVCGHEGSPDGLSGRAGADWDTIFELIIEFIFSSSNIGIA